MTLKIVLLFAMVALVFGSPALQSPEDSRLNTKEFKPETLEIEGLDALVELIAQGVKEGDGSLVIHFDGEKKSGDSLVPQTRSVLCVGAHVTIFGKKIGLEKCW